MQLLFMKQWLSDSVIRAICWTLIHSLWQGLILAALAGLLVLLTRKSMATIRYNMLAILFFVFMGVVASTFIYELSVSAPHNNIINLTPAVQPDQTINQVVVVDGPAQAVSSNEGYITRFVSYFNQHASLFVAIWFLVFLAKAVKLMGSLVYIQRIRHYKTHTPAQYWVDRLKVLTNTLGVKVPVHLLESEIVKVPLVAGFLKPVILVPLGLMANMPADQVEAILLHELAHIRRRDFLVNLAQSFAETLFFFNPAVLWLSALLREEREHCCDDMAIAVTQSKTGYIHALVSFQEYQLGNTPEYAMAFPGKKNHLLNRVKRIIDNSNKTLNMAERSFLILCCSLIGILTMVFAQPAPKDVKADKEKTTIQQPTQQPAVRKTDDNTKLTQQVASFRDESKDESHDNGIDRSIDKSGRLSVRDESVLVNPDTNDRSIYIRPYTPTYKPYTTTYQPSDRKLLVVPGVKDTMPILRKGNSVMSGTITHNKGGKEYKITIDNNLATGLTVDGVKVPDEKLLEMRDVINDIFREMQADAEQTYADRVQENNNATVVLATNNATLRDQAVQLQKSQLLSPGPQLRMGMRAGDNKFRLRDPEKIKPVVNETVDSIVVDLLKSGLATQKDPLSFKLNKNEFIVNGKEITGEMRRIFQEKYIRTPSYSYGYARQGGSVSTYTYID